MLQDDRSFSGVLNLQDWLVHCRNLRCNPIVPTPHLFYQFSSQLIFSIELCIGSWRIKKPQYEMLSSYRDHMNQNMINGIQHGIPNAWHTWKCRNKTIVYANVHEHRSISHLANLSNHSGDVIAWRQLGMCAQGASHTEHKQNLANDISCALAQSCRISTCFWSYISTCSSKSSTFEI